MLIYFEITFCRSYRICNYLFVFLLLSLSHTHKKEYKNRHTTLCYMRWSISPTFYARLFCTKVLHETFLYLDLRFVLFWPKSRAYDVGEIDTRCQIFFFCPLSSLHTCMTHCKKTDESKKRCAFVYHESL